MLSLLPKDISKQLGKWFYTSADSASAGVNICLANLAKDQHFL